MIGDSEQIGYVCMAVYRPGWDLLQRQVASLRAQTLDAWRCIVGIDGADPDACRAVERAVAGDARFDIVEFSDNVGFYRNFERILALVPEEAPWVALSDQDDDWFPEKLATLADALDRGALAFGQAIVTGSHHRDGGETTRRRAVRLGAEMIDNQVTGSACMFRRELLNIALPFPEPTDLAFHDHWLGVCALVSGGIVAEPTPLQLYVQHGDNVIGEERARSLASRVVSTSGTARNRSSGVLRYLSDHRWGWRVSMARRLRSSGTLLSDADESVVRAFARGFLSPRLIKIFWYAIASGEAPVARAISLRLGALRRPRLGGEPEHRGVRRSSRVLD